MSAQARARVEWDPIMAGVRIITSTSDGSSYLVWPEPDRVARTEAQAGQELPREAWLRIPEDEARAIYEALGEYFGGTGRDTYALRKDYDGERARVDYLITSLSAVATAGGPITTPFRSTR